MQKAKISTCKINNEYCACQLLGRNTIIKLNCIEKTNDDFINDLKEVKETFVLTQMIELTVRNKLIKNISHSNISSLLTLNIKSLSINDCKISTINKGTFNLMLNFNFDLKFLRVFSS